MQQGDGEKKGQEKVKKYNEPKINREKLQFLSIDRQTSTNTSTISLKKILTLTVSLVF